MADDIVDQAVDRPEAAGDLESVHEVVLAGDRDANTVRSKVWCTGIEREPRNAMASEVGEACGLETAAKDEGYGRHAAWHDRTQWTSRK